MQKQPLISSSLETDTPSQQRSCLRGRATPVVKRKAEEGEEEDTTTTEFWQGERCAYLWEHIGATNVLSAFLSNKDRAALACASKRLGQILFPKGVEFDIRHMRLDILEMDIRRRRMHLDLCDTSQAQDAQEQEWNAQAQRSSLSNISRIPRCSRLRTLEVEYRDFGTEADTADMQVRLFTAISQCKGLQVLKRDLRERRRTLSTSLENAPHPLHLASSSRGLLHDVSYRPFCPGGRYREADEPAHPIV